MNDPDAFMQTSRPRSDTGDFDAVDHGVSLDPEPQSLEALVGLEMRANGFDPHNADDIRTYWKTLLEPRRIKHEPSQIQPYFTMQITNKKAQRAEDMSQFDEIMNTKLCQVHERSIQAAIAGGVLLL